MECLVVVREDARDHFTARAVGIPEVTAEAPTEAQAIERVRERLSEWLASARLVQVHVPVADGVNPWLATFGRSAGDPDFPELLEELQRSRSEDAAG